MQGAGAGFGKPQLWIRIAYKGFSFLKDFVNTPGIEGRKILLFEQLFGFWQLNICVLGVGLGIGMLLDYIFGVPIRL